MVEIKHRDVTKSTCQEAGFHPGGWVMFALNWKAEEEPATPGSLGRSGVPAKETADVKPLSPVSLASRALAWVHPPGTVIEEPDCPALGGALGIQAQRALLSPDPPQPSHLCHPMAHLSASACQEECLSLPARLALSPRTCRCPHRAVSPFPHHLSHV